MYKILSALLLLLCWLPQAEARMSVARPPVISMCPAGDLLPDGCGQSSIITNGYDGSQRLSNCWGVGGAINQLTGKSTDYSNQNPTHPVAGGVPWNSPGCEYGVGSDIPLSQLANPVTVGGTSAIPGCTYFPTGGYGGSAYMSCSGTSVPQTISGYNFGPVTGQPGSSNHGCIAFLFSGNLSAAAQANGEYIIHNYWKNDGNCVRAVNGPYFIGTVNSVTQPYFIMYNTFDGNGTTFSDFWGTCPVSSGTPCNITQALFLGSAASGGNLTVEYNSFTNFVLNGIYFVSANTISTATGQSFTFNYNYVQSWAMRYPTNHGEMFVPGVSPGAGWQYMSFNTIVEATGKGATDNAFYPTNFRNGGNSLFYFDHNIHIMGKPGNGNAGTIGPITIAAGGSTLSIPACSGGSCPALIGSGQALQSCLASGVFSPVAFSGILVPLSSGFTYNSAGPGGGVNVPASSSSLWGMDINVSSYQVRGYVDNGSGSAGTQLTVTQGGTFNILFGATGLQSQISGSGLTAAKVTGQISGTGGAGTYTIAGSPQLIGSAGSPVTITVSVPDQGPGNWSAQATITCPSQATVTNTASLMTTGLSANNGSGGYATASGVSISGTTMTIGSVTSGTVSAGLTISGPGVTTNTSITSGSGLSWVVSPSQTVAGPISITMQGGGYGTATGASISGTTMTLGAVTTGSVLPTLIVNGPGVTPGTTVVSGSGLSWTVSPSQTVAGPITVMFGGYSFGPQPAGYPAPVIITNNYIDPSASNPGFALSGGASSPSGGGGNVCTSPAIFSGNVNLAGTYTINGWGLLSPIGLAGGAGC